MQRAITTSSNVPSLRSYRYMIFFITDVNVQIMQMNADFITSRTSTCCSPSCSRLPPGGSHLPQAPGDHYSERSEMESASSADG